MPLAASMPSCSALRLASQRGLGPLPALAHRGLQRGRGQARQRAGQAERQHVDPAARHAPWPSSSAAASRACAPVRRNTSGTSPPSASPITRLPACSGISSAKRCTFCQSIASSRSKRSSSDSTGAAPRRSSAAASPPRICGPLVRTIRPYRPACAAASSSSVPAVITPLPPLPAMAIDSPAAAGPAPSRSGVVLSVFREASTHYSYGSCGVQ